MDSGYNTVTEYGYQGLDGAGKAWNWTKAGWDSGYNTVTEYGNQGLDGVGKAWNWTKAGLDSGYNTVTNNPGTSITTGGFFAGSYGYLKYYRHLSHKATAVASSAISTLPSLANVAYQVYGAQASAAIRSGASTVSDGVGKAWNSTKAGWDSGYNTVTSNPGTSITTGGFFAGSYGYLKYYRHLSHKAAAVASSTIATLPTLANVAYQVYGAQASAAIRSGASTVSDGASKAWNWSMTGWDTGYLAWGYNTVTGNPGTSSMATGVVAGAGAALKTPPIRTQCGSRVGQKRRPKSRKCRCQ